jgi:hypothetical protein
MVFLFQTKETAIPSSTDTLSSEPDHKPAKNFGMNNEISYSLPMSLQSSLNGIEFKGNTLTMSVTHSALSNTGINEFN